MYIYTIFYLPVVNSYWQPVVNSNFTIDNRLSIATSIQQYIHPLSTCVSSVNFIGLTVFEKSVTKNFNVWKLERKKTEEIKFLGLTAPEKSVTKIINFWTIWDK